MIESPLSPQQRERILHGTVWAGLAVLFFSRLAFNVADLDIWHEMALVRDSLAAGHLSTANWLAYTPRLPEALQHEWGAGVIAYLLARYLGAAGVLAFKYLVAGSMAWLCVSCARARGAGLATFSALAPVGILFAGLAFAPIRGHMYSLWFCALLLWCLERDERGERRWMALWLGLFPLWVNLHAGFAVGILLLAAHAIESMLLRKPAARLFGVVAAMVAMIAINPYGWRYYGHLWSGLTLARPGIAEWRPLWQSFPSVYSVSFAVSAVVAAYAARARGRWERGTAILLATAAATCQHQRMFPFYALAFTCYVPAYLEQSALGERLRASFRLHVTAWQAAWTGAAAFFLCAAISFHPWQMRVPGDAGSDEVAYPVGAVNYLASERFHGNIMTPFEYGAYVSWRLWPAAKVSLDSRFEEAYPIWWVDQSFRFYDAEPGWQATLRGYATDVVLVRKLHPLAQAMPATGWKQVYADRAYELFARPGLALPAVDYAGRAFDGNFP